MQGSRSGWRQWPRRTGDYDLSRWSCAGSQVCSTVCHRADRGTSGFNAHDHAPGMAMGNFTIESAFPIWDGTRWVVGLNVTGNSAGEDKYGCTNVGSVKTGPYVLTPANPTASGNGSPAYCNSKCSCFGYPMTFTMGAFSPTGPLSWQVPFTFTYESHSIAVMVTGTFLDTYSVAPLTGCFQEEQTLGCHVHGRGHLWRVSRQGLQSSQLSLRIGAAGDGILLDVREHLQVSGTVGMFDDATDYSMHEVWETRQSCAVLRGYQYATQ